MKNSKQYTRTWNNDDEEDEEGGERQQKQPAVVAEDADDSTRNAILDHIHTLIEWERRRRTTIAMLGEEIEESGEGNYDVDYEYDDDDDDDDGNTMPMSPRTAMKKKGMIAEQGNRRVFSSQYIILRRKSNHSISLSLHPPSKLSTKTKAFCTTRNGITKIEEGT